MLNVIFEDNHLIAINKKSSDIVQGDKTGDIPLSEHVKRYLKEKYDKPGEVYCGVIHRLDRPVSGVVLFAKTDKALSRMNEMFRTREIKKTYWAIVGTKPEKDTGTLVHYLKKNEKTNKSHATKFEVAGSLKSETEYKLIASSDRYFLLEVEPHTGRHHQIRVQLASMGCIIKGDLKYGAPRSNKDASICLHARKLEFMHPVKKEPITIIADVPEDPLWKAFEKMVVENTK
ncbi:MAG: RluA family pseudouridine synthase [Bacteroidetes bacterium]|jgi:23S rRNA pseudouridine1911/1915/1917 synthase|nr:RluA family pseudouridine synthase [Bacteroidota bacterium]